MHKKNKKILRRSTALGKIPPTGRGNPIARPYPQPGPIQWKFLGTPLCAAYLGGREIDDWPISVSVDRWRHRVDQWELLNLVISVLKTFGIKSHLFVKLDFSTTVLVVTGWVTEKIEVVCWSLLEVSEAVGEFRLDHKTDMNRSTVLDHLKSTKLISFNWI